MHKLLHIFKIYLWPHIGLFLLVIATGALAAAASGMGIPLMFSTVFPVLFTGIDTLPEALRPYLVGIPHESLILWTCACIPFVFLLRGSALWSNAVLVNLLAIRVLRDIRMSLFTRLQKLPLSYIERQQKGDLVSRLLSDSHNVQSLISAVSNDLVKQPLTCIVALGTFIYLLMDQNVGWSFALNLLLGVLAVYPIIIFGKRIAKNAQNAQASLGNLTARVQQNLETQREVRAYSLEAREIQDFEKVSQNYASYIVKLVKYQKSIPPMIETVASVALAILLVRGKMMGMNLSDFLALAAALFLCFDSMKRAARAWNRINEGQGAMNRLMEILNAPNTMPDPEFPLDLPELQGEICFKDVSFAYTEGHEVLRDVNLTIPAGQIVGLVGPSGAGKTTFATLIPRFYDVSKGAILVDGVDVRDIRQAQLREHIALVGQHAVLFKMSIGENIALGHLDCSPQQVEAAAKSAAIFDSSDEQSLHLDTAVGLAGTGLSGGQRQRVAIARAFVKDAPILILDEATASLDAKSERKIQEQLVKLSQGRTTLIVAHRFSTIRHAHRILVFDYGTIIADGTHEELIENSKLYRELYEAQSLEEA